MKACNLVVNDIFSCVSTSKRPHIYEEWIQNGYPYKIGMGIIS